MTHNLQRAIARVADAPVLLIDPEQVGHAAAAFERDVAIPAWYAVKANPHPAVLAVLAQRGWAMDVASTGEIEACLQAGVEGAKMSFGHPVKTAKAITHAARHGVRRYTIDCQEEADKVAVCAGPVEVMVRLDVGNAGARWPLAGKFGTSVEEAVRVLMHARNLGLVARGVSFHVGSQQTDPLAWRPAIEAAIAVANLVPGVDLLNIGGGFPDTTGVAPLIGQGIHQALQAWPGPRPEVMAEPGRAIVANAGWIVAEVVQASNRGGPDRWVTLNIGRFGGLAETEGEMIQYPIEALDVDGPPVKVILAGPTCDGVDVLYRKTPYWLPSGVRAGSRVLIKRAGAYTWSYASVEFNGFDPIRVEVV